MAGLARAARARILPTSEPAGTVATRTAGVAGFGATLLWDRGESAPPTPALPALPRTVRCSVVESDGPGEEEARREILGEIRALTERDLGLALETVLRSLTVAAALSDALMETRVLRVTPPKATPSRIVQTLALDLWRAGFPVRFGRSWTPVPDPAAVAVGFGGAQAQELARFLETHPSWEMS